MGKDFLELFFWSTGFSLGLTALARFFPASAYGRAGTPELWIVNLIDLVIEVYREPHFAGYGSKVVLRAGDKAAPQAFPDVTLNVGELLKR